jgi:hypothetical protein
MPARPSVSPMIVLAVGALALLGVVWLFQGVLDSPQELGCNSSLPPGTYRSAFAPAHLAVAAVLVGCLWSLGENRTALGIAGAVAILCAVVPPVFAVIALVAVVTAPTIGSAAALVLVIRTAIVARRIREPMERRAALTQCARYSLWLALVMLLPASAVFAYLRGASIFCF